MNDLNPGYGSPYVQAVRATSPKEVMFRLHREHPQADKDELLRLFRLEAESDLDLANVCVEIAAINSYNALENIRSRAVGRIAENDSTPEQRRQQQTQEATQQATVIVKRIVRSAILDFVMPNNKKLRDCTFREVGKFGRGFSRIAAAGDPKQVVGKVLSENKARSLMGSK